MTTLKSNLRISTAAVALGVLITYAVGFWTVTLAQVQGANGQGRSELLLHWLRDSTVALPAVVVAVAAALALAARSLVPRAGAPGYLRPAIAAAAVAPAASLAFAASAQIRELLFGAQSGDALPLPLHLVRDTLVALPVALLVAALACAVLLRERAPGTSRRGPSRRTGLLAGLAAVGVAATMGGSVRAADTGPGQPCPAGAPVKSFDVHAIDVDITLNRFGDHDPTGKMYVLASRIADVRTQETAALPNRVSIGLREDAIQPLSIRANEGDCVEINFTNEASGGPYGVHIDGLSFESGSSGDAVGQNAPSDVAAGGTRTYRYYVPNDPAVEGAHYMRPGPGNRQAVAHGLFGTLSVEPPGSTYTNITTGAPLASGWEATIVPGNGRPSFREFVQIYHEVGDEGFLISTASGGQVPLVDPFTTSYRPDARAINYRSEPFMNRLQANKKQESLAYGSYAFGDPATPMMRGYLGDPTKIRLVHGGGEMFHVFHLHGGGDRWRFNPSADSSQDYAKTGLDKGSTQFAPSSRLDSQAFGPGESYNLEIEGGAGGVQQAAGDFLYHCHIAEHYISGMWSFWRVYDTNQPDLAPLPDRTPLPDAVDSAHLIGRTFGGTTITSANVDAWIKAQLPPQGVQHNDQDAAVWNYTVDRSVPGAPVYLGEPEDKSSWPDLPNIDPAHPGSLITDLAPGQIVSTPTGDRPKIMFDPRNGRPAWPMMRPHIGDRPPFSPQGHSGAPWLGEDADAAAPASPAVDPYAARADGLCPAGAPLRHFNVVAITLPIANTKKLTDPTGMIYTLAENKAGVYAGTKPAEPLAIRSNIHDCDAVTLTSEETDATQASGFAKVNMHIHHVQFDPQASDGVITGMSYEQSVRPYKVEDPTLTAAAPAGATTLALTSVAKFRHTCADGSTCDGVWIGIGLGTESIEVRQIASIDEAGLTVTLTKPLSNDHAAGDAAGTEFTQYRWYPDVALDNIFWHDHVDGIHNWGHGLVGQLIIEPKGSTYHDPKTGEVVDSGTIVDIHTPNPLVAGVVDGDFREMALWTIDENPNTDATLNLKAEPWADRLGANPDPSLLFSSYTHGDPITPLPLAYPGDPFVIRTINVGPTVDGLHIDGHRFPLENRYDNAAGGQEASQSDTLLYGISEKYSLVLNGGAGGPLHQPGDYLYENSVGRKFRDGAWGILRVLAGQSPDLLPLPDRPAPPPAVPLPTQTGGRPPATTDPGNPCPAGAPTRNFAVSAVDVNLSGGLKGPSGAFVRTGSVVPTRSLPAPLVLHAAVGDCIEVAFTNLRTVRSSFHLDMLLRTPESSGVNAGFNAEQTVAPGGSRTYRYYADDGRYETALISDYGGANAVTDPTTGVLNPIVDPSRDGMYGSLELAPTGATFTDPALGGPVDMGTQVDVHVPGQPGYRDFTLFLADQDPNIGQNQMPYPTQVNGPATINYATVGPRPDDANMFSSAANGGDPPTPILRAYPGDAVHVHAIGAPGNEQTHSFSLGGIGWPSDPLIALSNDITARGLPPMGVVEAHTIAGGRNHALGDFFYGDLRRPFTVAGMWGLQRVVDPVGCPMMGLDGGVCGGTILAAGIALAPTAVAFGDQAVGTTSVTHAITLTNNGGAPLTITSLTIADSEFVRASDTCLGSSVAAGKSCTVNVTFSPTSTGPHSSSLQIVDNAPNSPHSVALAGTGVNDTVVPTVSLTAPAAGATVSGTTVSVSANAADNVGVASVQFKVDGANLGAPDTTQPYSITWDSTMLANGSHTLDAVARDAAGNTATSSVTVTSSNSLLAVVLGDATTEAKVASAAPGRAFAFKTTATATHSLTRLRVYLDAGSTVGSVSIGLYTNKGGHPGALLTSGTIASPVAGEDNLVSVAAVSVKSGNTFWIAILGTGSTGTLVYRDRAVAGKTKNSESSSSSTLTALPATWATGTTSSDAFLSAVGLG